jgi:hypothetical protein
MQTLGYDETAEKLKEEIMERRKPRWIKFVLRLLCV